MPPEEQPPQNIERMRRKLYGRGAATPPLRRSFLSAPPAEPKVGWETLKKAPEGKKGRWLWLFFWVSLGVFLVAAAGVGWVFWSGGNQVSAANVEIALNGPLSVRAGTPTVLQVELVNRNDVSLESVDLVIEYPPGTREAASGRELDRERIALGEIAARATVRRAFDLVFFAPKNEKVDVNFTLEYRLAGSNAIFDKKENFSAQIEDSPLSVKVSGPTEINPGEDVAMMVEITANSETPFEGGALILEPPPGFTLTGGDPPSSPGWMSWSLGQMAPGSRRQIELTGQLAGESGDVKVFRFLVGLPDKDGEIGALLASNLSSVTINRSPVRLVVSVNESDLVELAAASREDINVAVEWENNLNQEISDAELMVIFSGAAVDPTSVRAGQGFYDSLKNMILWHPATTAELQRIIPGGVGQTNFHFASVSLLGDGFRQSNPEINFTVKFRGKVVEAENQSRVIEAEVARKIRLNSVIQLSAKAFFAGGVPPGSGPLPPKVGEETIYTVVWSMVNSSNDVEDVVVKAELPVYMRWTGYYQSSDEILEFTPREAGGGELSWRLGRIRAGTGFSAPAREVSFQIALQPSASQIGSAPVILGASTLSARDTFSGVRLENIRSALTTYLRDDPFFRLDEERVVP